MAAALLSKYENNVLIVAGRIISKLLNNAALISSQFSRCFQWDLHLETAEDIPSCVYYCFRPMPTPRWFSGKEHCLTGTQMSFVGP